MDGFTLATFILVIVIIAVFAWLVKLFYELRSATENGFSDVEYKITGLETATIALKKELDKIDAGLENKIDRKYLDERMDELIKAVKRKR